MTLNIEPISIGIGFAAGVIIFFLLLWVFKKRKPTIPELKQLTYESCLDMKSAYEKMNRLYKILNQVEK